MMHKRVFSIDGIAPTVVTPTGGGHMAKIIEYDLPQCVSYTRDRKGKIMNYHLKDVANTVHPSSAGGGNTSMYVMEEPFVVAVRGRKYERTATEAYSHGQQVSERSLVWAQSTIWGGKSNGDE